MGLVVQGQCSMLSLRMKTSSTYNLKILLDRVAELDSEDLQTPSTTWRKGLKHNNT